MKYVFSEQSLSVAVLELFAAAAGARIVSSGHFVYMYRLLFLRFAGISFCSLLLILVYEVGAAFCVLGTARLRFLTCLLYFVGCLERNLPAH